MPRRRKPSRSEDASVRIRHLIALDASSVVRRLEARADEMVSLFSRLRDREPLLETVKTWFGSITFQELAALPTTEQRAVSAFYSALDELRWYLRYTEDMPLSVRTTVTQHRLALRAAYEKLIAALGATDDATGPVVEAEVVERAPIVALPRGKKQPG